MPYSTKAKSRCFSAPDGVWASAQKLAEQNTNGNVSELITRLINYAALLPQQFDLAPDQEHSMTKHLLDQALQDTPESILTVS